MRKTINMKKNSENKAKENIEIVQDQGQQEDVPQGQPSNSSQSSEHQHQQLPPYPYPAPPYPYYPHSYSQLQSSHSNPDSQNQPPPLQYSSPHPYYCPPYCPCSRPRIRQPRKLRKIYGGGIVAIIFISVLFSLGIMLSGITVLVWSSPPILLGQDDVVEIEITISRVSVRAYYIEAKEYEAVFFVNSFHIDEREAFEGLTIGDSVYVVIRNESVTRLDDERGLSISILGLRFNDTIVISIDSHNQQRYDFWRADRIVPLVFAAIFGGASLIVLFFYLLGRGLRIKYKLRKSEAFKGENNNNK